MKKIVLAFAFCSSINWLFAQQQDSDSSGICNLRISLLTCTPGAELYSTFGHSALRVSDNKAGTDIIYNYGTFDFNDPGFYSKFVRGKLLYFVSIDDFNNFLEQYKYEQRGIIEQVLDLDCAKKTKLIAALQENLKPENRYYKYDFVYDNCTTRLRDIVFSSSENVSTADVRPAQRITFRNLIHEYLNKGKQPWSKFGIDILLGSPLDKKISNSEAMFLPDYLLKGFDSTAMNGKDLVSEKKEILAATAPLKKDSLFTPFVVFGILLLIIAALNILNKGKKFLDYFDFILFFLTGALGVLLLFMWFGTDHQTCKNNLNLIWAFPTHLIIAFFIFKKRDWIRRYFLFNTTLLALLLITWKWLPQEMNNGLLPVVALLLLRSFIRFKKLGNGN